MCHLPGWQIHDNKNKDMIYTPEDGKEILPSFFIHFNCILSEIVTVQPKNKANITVTIDELDITGLYVGQSCEITFDALSGQRV